MTDRPALDAVIEGMARDLARARIYEGYDAETTGRLVVDAIYGARRDANSALRSPALQAVLREAAEALHNRLGINCGCGECASAKAALAKLRELIDV